MNIFKLSIYPVQIQILLLLREFGACKNIFRLSIYPLHIHSAALFEGLETEEVIITRDRPVPLCQNSEIRSIAQLKHIVVSLFSYLIDTYWSEYTVPLS